MGFEPTISSVTGRRFKPAKLRLQEHFIVQQKKVFCLSVPQDFVFFSKLKYCFLIKGSSYNLQPNRKSINKAARNRHCRKSRKVDWASIHVLQIHSEGVFRFLADLKCHLRSRQRKNHINFLKCFFKILPYKRSHFLRLQVIGVRKRNVFHCNSRIADQSQSVFNDLSFSASDASPKIFLWYSDNEAAGFLSFLCFYGSGILCIFSSNSIKQQLCIANSICNGSYLIKRRSHCNKAAAGNRSICRL